MEHLCFYYEVYALKVATFVFLLSLERIGNIHGCSVILQKGELSLEGDCTQAKGEKEARVGVGLVGRQRENQEITRRKDRLRV